MMLNEAELLSQSPQFVSNIPRLCEEPEKLTKMLQEPENTILMSGGRERRGILRFCMIIVGYDRKVLLETGSGYRFFLIFIPLYITGTGNLK